MPFYVNSGTMYQPVSGKLGAGGIFLAQNQAATGVSGALPYFSHMTMANIIVNATAWGDATLNVEASFDGVNGWSPVTNIDGVPLSALKANGWFAVPLRTGVFLRANITSTTGTGINVVLYG